VKEAHFAVVMRLITVRTDVSISVRGAVVGIVRADVFPEGGEDARQNVCRLTD
jgi:hypothetical protein